MRVGIAGIGLQGPGLAGWAASRAVLAGAAPYVPAETVLPPPAMLPATERRRTGPVTRLALAVAAEAAAMSGLPPGSLRSVFASSNGDGLTVGTILDALSRPDGMVSPTQFHNSVHNAAAGYWSIGVASAEPATVLGCHDFSFAAGLLKAAAEVVTERAPVLLVVYDVPFATPLLATRPMAAAFGVALVLTPETGGATLDVAFGCEPAADTLPQHAGIACGNPAARSLPLLEALAGGNAAALTLGYLDGHLSLRLSVPRTMASLVPHAGAMCLLSHVVAWSADGIACAATSHLDPGNPLRRDGRLGAGAAIEYAMQAAAAHGALLHGATQKPGYLAAIRNVVLHADRLDDPAHGTLAVTADLTHADAAGLIYTFAVRSESGAPLADGRATVVIP